MMRRGIRIAVALCAMGMASCAASTAAFAQEVHWAISSLAQPTNFTTTEATACVSVKVCPMYAVTVTNVGGAATSGPVTIVDTLPEGVAFQRIETGSPSDALSSEGEGFEWVGEHTLPCAEEEIAGRWKVTCTFGESGESAPAGDTLQVTIMVKPTASGAQTLTNEASVSGGGAAAPAVARTSNMLDGTPPGFGIAAFEMEAYGPDGGSETQAGGHPSTLRTSFAVNNEIEPGVHPPTYIEPVQQVKTLVVSLPFGFVGDPMATPTCPEYKLTSGECPRASRVGEVAADLSGRDAGFDEAYAYNLTPERDRPAEFGYVVEKITFVVYPTVVRTPQGYRLKVAVPNFLHEVRAGAVATVVGGSLTFFGNPSAFNGNETSPEPFLTNPGSCTSEPLYATMEADSWEEPGNWQRAQAAMYPEGITGCSLLQFNPELQVRPDETTQTDTPSGYEVKLSVPQGENSFTRLSAADLRNAVVTLPAGVSLSPAAANGTSGLRGCQAQGPEGINIGSEDITPQGQDLGDPEATELGEGHAGAGGNESPYDDGLWHTAPGHCSQGSQVGEVTVKSPLLKEPLSGHVYLAQPGCGGSGQPECTEKSAEDGELYGLYMEVSGEGVILKLHGKVSVNPHTGQITTTFAENPQFPFETLTLKLHGGQRAPLANPQTCGTFTTTSELEPWGGTTVTPGSLFTVGGCESPVPFKPGFEAGTVKPLAGEFSPFTTTLTRNDGEQDLAGVSVTLPPGVAGLIAKVARCGEAQANTGECPESSRIGTARVAAGAGSEPLWLEGQVYLTGPYKGAPFGLSVVVPAKAGPFNLGNEIVRAAISVNPTDAQVTVTSDPLPQSKDGVPFRIKQIDVSVDRPEFLFNPTNCSQLQVTGTMVGDLPGGAPGASVPVSDPFAVAGCANLPFKPSFTVSTQGSSSRHDGASLTVKVGSRTGQANIAKVHVSLPKQLPSRLGTLKLACTGAVFAANPAGCPVASRVGIAIANTPILSTPLTGPAYLVSHGGAAFPDLEIVLQGEGITLIVDGKTNIENGITTSSFDTVPDAPISSFELKLPQGRYSALAAPGGDLCSQTLTMPTAIQGQNGALVEQSTPIEVTGCPYSMSVLHRKVNKQTLTLTVAVPQAGRLLASGKSVSSTAKSAKARQTVTLTLKERKAGKLHTRITLRFTPVKGKQREVLRKGITVTFD